MRLRKTLPDIEQSIASGDVEAVARAVAHEIGAYLRVRLQSRLMHFPAAPREITKDFLLARGEDIQQVTGISALRFTRVQSPSASIKSRCC